MRNTRFIEMEQNFQKDINYIQEVCDEGSPLGRLSSYLLTTERNPYSIVSDRGYSPSSASNFSSFLHTLNHAINDDGDITFYMVEGSPRIAFFHKGEVEADFFLSEQERELKKSMSIDYEIEFFSYDYDNIIDEWIKISEESFIADIKQCFQSDYEMHGEQMIKHYRESYSFFDMDWIE